MSIENLQPMQLTSSEQITEGYLEQFEVDYPGMLIDVVDVKEVLKEMIAGSNDEV